MIKLTGLSGKEFYLNCDLIEKLEVTPDTVVTTTTDKKFIVRESPDVIIQRIINFRRKYYSNIPEVSRE
ncbi:MAG: flagellar FlbD family protein [Clostridiales bacterium]|nr:flagellar FlbD family protein [Clostridiales bacterium]HBM81499.1 endoflagellar protein [Clostridiaceae bacterium]